MDYARKVFDKLIERDIFLWNTIIQGYSKHGFFEDALSSCVQMQVAGLTLNQHTFPFRLKACAETKDMKMGQLIHAHTVKYGFASDRFVDNALVSFYGKCQEVKSSRKAFNELLQKDIVSWNSMISAYVANDLLSEALEFFHSMLNAESISADRATLVAILPTCAQLSAVNGFILAYGTHGHADEALKLFSQLVDTGLCPDGLIFLCLLSACSHAGMISEGLFLFEKMEQYGAEKTHYHYGCIIDLCGRAGLIDEAIGIVRTMPIEAGKDPYGALLGACKIHNNIEIAEVAAKKLFDLDPGNPGRYLILIKMYEDAGRHQDAARLRKMLRDKKIQRPVGCSAIEVDYTLHIFGVEDESHLFKEQIFDTLQKLEMIRDETIIADQLVVNS